MHPFLKCISSVRTQHKVVRIAAFLQQFGANYFTQESLFGATDELITILLQYPANSCRRTLELFSQQLLEQVCHLCMLCYTCHWEHACVNVQSFFVLFCFYSRARNASELIHSNTVNTTALSSSFGPFPSTSFGLFDFVLCELMWICCL